MNASSAINLGTERSRHGLSHIRLGALSPGHDLRTKQPPMPGSCSRRKFLAMTGAIAVSRSMPRLQAAAVLFEEIPAGASGITFVHENAMSEERYLPETVGAGCGAPPITRLDGSSRGSDCGGCESTG